MTSFSTYGITLIGPTVELRYFKLVFRLTSVGAAEPKSGKVEVAGARQLDLQTPNITSLIDIN
jgi:hypothetical protein